MAFYKAAVCKI